VFPADGGVSIQRPIAAPTPCLPSCWRPLGSMPAQARCQHRTAWDSMWPMLLPSRVVRNPGRSGQVLSEASAARDPQLRRSTASEKHSLPNTRRSRHLHRGSGTHRLDADDRLDSDPHFDTKQHVDFGNSRIHEVSPRRFGRTDSCAFLRRELACSCVENQSPRPDRPYRVVFGVRSIPKGEPSPKAFNANTARVCRMEVARLDRAGFAADREFRRVRASGGRLPWVAVALPWESSLLPGACPMGDAGLVAVLAVGPVASGVERVCRSWYGSESAIHGDASWNRP
jgi:hypothetical protein